MISALVKDESLRSLAPLQPGAGRSSTTVVILDSNMPQLCIADGQVMDDENVEILHQQRVHDAALVKMEAFVIERVGSMP